MYYMEAKSVINFVFQMIHSGHIKIYFISVETTYTTNLRTQFGNARTAVHNEAMSYPPKKAGIRS